MILALLTQLQVLHTLRTKSALLLYAFIIKLSGIQIAIALLLPFGHMHVGIIYGTCECVCLYSNLVYFYFHLIAGKAVQRNLFIIKHCQA